MGVALRDAGIGVAEELLDLLQRPAAPAPFGRRPRRRTSRAKRTVNVRGGARFATAGSAHTVGAKGSNSAPGSAIIDARI